MNRQIISNQSLRALQEYLVAWSTLSEISNLFEDEGIFRREDFDPGESSQRRNLIKQYYASCDLSDWNDVRKVLKIFESAVIELQTGQSIYFHEEKEQHCERILNYLKRDGFELDGNRLVKQGGKLALKELSSHAEKLSANNLHLQISRIEASVEIDPDLAIGTAKELVETTCKTILSEGGVAYNGLDLMALVKETRKVLQLTPDDIPDTAKAATTIKRMLNNLGTITQGLAELRNSYGTGHGKEGRKSGLQPRHARLAVGAATTLAAFLLETHEMRD